MKIDIANFELIPLQKGRYIKPWLARYVQDGEERSWEVLEAGDSVAVLIYHKKKDSFVLVRQFRPAVFMKNDDGITVELCAGLLDKDLSPEETAVEEIEEECGYCVEPESLFKIASFYTSVGFAGSRQTLFYTEVDESMKCGPGGGVEGEKIEIVEVPVRLAENIMRDDDIAKTPGLLFAIEWWFAHQGSLRSEIENP